MKHKKALSILLISSLILSGCGPFSSDEENETPTETEKVIAIPEVQVEKSIRTSFTPQLDLSGTIVAKEEITIASEVTGTVAKVLKKEGSKISEGTKVMDLESSTNLLRASYSSAQVAVNNSAQALVLTKRSSVQDIANAQLQIKNAEIALKNAEISYKRVKDAQIFTQEGQSAQTSGSEKSLEIALKNVEIAQQAKEDVIVNHNQSELRSIENIANALSQILIPLRSHMTFADELIGASEYRKHENDSFEVYLSGTNGNLIQDTQTLWNVTNPLIEEFEITFAAFEKLKYVKADRNIMEIQLYKAIDKLKRVRKILRNIETLLAGSIESTTFSSNTIDLLQSEVSSFQQSIELNIKSMIDLQQALIDLDIQYNQSLANAELNISVMESQLESAKNALIAAENNEGTVDVNNNSELDSANNAVLNAQNALAVAKSQLESVKIQGELSSQSALAQKDSAQASLDQAALSLSKLSILSGISGTVTHVLAQDGDTISPGTPLMVVSDFSELKLVTDVSVEESFLLKKGMKATVAVEGIESVFAGTVSIVYPEADRTTRRVRVEITIPNKTNIPANVFATASIDLAKEKPEVYIPLSSLISQNPPSIFLIEENDEGKTVLKTKEIELGEERRGMVAVTKGLRPNQLIVTEKYRSLFDGDEVIVKMKGEEIEEDQEEEIQEEKSNQPENRKESSTENSKSSKEKIAEEKNNTNKDWNKDRDYPSPLPVSTPSSPEAERENTEDQKNMTPTPRPTAQTL